MTLQDSPSLFARHPRVTILAVLFVGVLLLSLAAEIGLRAFGSLNIHYYTGFRTPGVHKYPYGEIPFNSDQFPDEEFDLRSSKHRIGYFGDSVAYGLGAGYGYRIPDLLQRQFPNHHHWVFAMVGEMLSTLALSERTHRFGLNSIVYLMNLNDILPRPAEEGGTTWITQTHRGPMRRLDEAVRGRSYLYTYVRLGLKNALQRRGYEPTGMMAFERFPAKNKNLVDATVERIAAELKGVERSAKSQVCVVILPYEMQISRDAARRYRELGIDWEEGFEGGSTQRMLMAGFEQQHIRAFDAMEAFKGRDPRVGETFVYNRGDKIDWNHPNRSGHAIIAEWLAANKDFVSACLSSADKAGLSAPTPESR